MSSTCMGWLDASENCRPLSVVIKSRSRTSWLQQARKLFPFIGAVCNLETRELELARNNIARIEPITNSQVPRLLCTRNKKGGNIQSETPQQDHRAQQETKTAAPLTDHVCLLYIHLVPHLPLQEVVQDLRTVLQIQPRAHAL